MKGYYYLLFRIYRLYKDKMKESDNLAIISVLSISTTLISINLITIYLIVNYFGLTPIVTNKLCMILFMVSIGLFNYYYIIRKRSFLNQSFQKDRNGGILIISYFVLTFLIYFFVAQYNREKFFIEQTDIVPKEPRKESLEGKIRKWFE